MATRMTLTANRAIYDTFSHQRGAKPEFVSDRTSNELIELLHSGDRALDRTEGYFFGTINGQFVVCFEQKRKDAHSRGGSMAYFDVFWLPVRDIRDVSLHDLVKSLRELRSDGYTADISEQTEVSVAELSEIVSESQESSSPSEQQLEKPIESENPPSDQSESKDNTTSKEIGDDDGFVDASKLNADTDTGTNPATGDSNTSNEDPDSSIDHPEGGSLRPPSSEFIAQLWEQYRRKGHHMSVDLTQLDQFHYFVRGTPKEFKGVSKERQETDRFDLVIEQHSEELSLADTDLVTIVDELRNEQTPIDINELPTYHDELKRKQEEYEKQIQEPEDVFSRIDDSIDRLQTNLEQLMQQQNRHSAKVYRKALAGDLEKNDDSRFSSIGSFTDVVGGDNSGDREFLDDVEASKIDQETVDYIVDEIVDSSPGQEIQPRIEKEINKFRDEMVNLTEQSERGLAKRVIRAIEELRTSTAYERAPDDEN